MSSLSSFKTLSTKKPTSGFKTRGQLEEERRAEQPAKKSRPDGPSQYETPLPMAESASPASPVSDALPPVDEVIRALRARNEPVTLFGETAAGRFSRLRNVEATVAEAPVNQNVFAQVMESLELDEKTDPDLAALQKLVRREGDKEKEGEEGEKTEKKRTRENAPEDELLEYFLSLLEMNGDDLARRTPSEAKSLQGKKEKAVWKQTLVYILPLFRRLASRTLESSMMEPLVSMMGCMKARDYAAAENAYLLLAIGKAAWPMGVTSVGIHERAAREKISNGTAHVLNDEVQRKYIQSVKRLITFCAKKYPSSTSATW